jgi:hypothetical protein
MNVVLPAPFGPISAWRAPAFERERHVARGAQRAEILADAAGFEQHLMGSCPATVRLAGFG